jgi:hypothetical protein
LTERIWLKRLTGEGDPPNRLDAVIMRVAGTSPLARADEDDRIIRYIGSLDIGSLDVTDLDGQQ